MLERLLSSPYQQGQVVDCSYVSPIYTRLALQASLVYADFHVNALI